MRTSGTIRLFPLTAQVQLKLPLQSMTVQPISRQYMRESIALFFDYSQVTVFHQITNRVRVTTLFFLVLAEKETKVSRGTKYSLSHCVIGNGLTITQPSFQSILHVLLNLQVGRTIPDVHNTVEFELMLRNEILLGLISCYQAFMCDDS